ncbi:hypothetical protein FA13DRAFT_556399 [Coprinellus micaceus]|uniref:Uncharacterized protein n=1 Tax=Coprinellus micaceus TaxID=71717 RepID=A0A4Y7SB15_COPMI|nr:hypothetical protein FA13DRAFT_556399 [Coprinellus micaceus]
MIPNLTTPLSFFVLPPRSSRAQCCILSKIVNDPLSFQLDMASLVFKLGQPSIRRLSQINTRKTARRITGVPTDVRKKRDYNTNEI